MLKKLKYTQILVIFGIIFLVVTTVISPPAGETKVDFVYIISALVASFVGFLYFRVSSTPFGERHKLLMMLLFILLLGIPVMLAFSGVPNLEQVARARFWFVLSGAGFGTWQYIKQRRREGKFEEDAENIESYSKGLVLAIAVIAVLVLPFILLAVILSSC